MNIRTTRIILPNRCSSLQPRVTKTYRRNRSKKSRPCYSSVNPEHSFELSENSIAPSNDIRSSKNASSTKSFYSQPLNGLFDQKKPQENHTIQASHRKKRKPGITGYLGCTRLCLILGVLATVLIGSAIAASLISLLHKSITTITTDTTATTTTDTTTTTITDTTTSVTTSTTTSTTSTTTATTETITMTYAPTGIYALKIPPCATWDPNGVTIAGNENGAAGTNLRSLDKPVTIFIDNNYTLYVCDRDNHRVMKYYENATNGIIVGGVTGSPGSGPLRLNEPKGVAVDQEGGVIVADSLNYRIQRFAPNSTSGVKIGQNTSTTPLGETRELRIDVNNVVYVTDSDYSRIVKFFPGSLVGTIVAGSSGSGPGANQFQSPFGTFVNESKILYVADYGNHRIQRWMPGANSGTTVAGITGSPGSSLMQLKTPHAITIDNNGYIYIADYGNDRVIRWTENYAAGGQCIVGCSGSSGTGPTKLDGPRDVKFDASGNLYVSDQRNNRVQKYGIQISPNCSASGR